MAARAGGTGLKMMEEPPPMPPEWEAFIEPEPAVACDDPTMPLAFWAAKMLREGFSREQVAHMLMEEATKVIKPVERRQRMEKRDREEAAKRKREEEEERRRVEAFHRATHAYHNYWRRKP